MRRADRELTDLSAIRSILEDNTHLHLAITGDAYPYLVPMNYGFELTGEGKLTLYLHCAGEGKKLDLLRSNPQVCFEISREYCVVPAKTACGWSNQYRSLIGLGTAVIETSRADKQRTLTHLMHHLGYEGAPCFTPEALDRVATLRIEVSSFTAKSNIVAGEAAR